MSIPAGETAPATRADARWLRSGERRPLIRRRRFWLALAILLLLLAAATAWVAVRALGARDALASAAAHISELRAAVVDEPARAVALADDVAADTGRAASLTSDPIWRAAELLPWAGDDLSAVRRLAQAVDDLARDAVVPLAGAAGSLDPSALTLGDGRIDLDPLQEVAPTVRVADDAVRAAAAEVDDISAAGLTGQVVDARTRLSGLLTEAAELTGTARGVVDVVPAMLGADGPRTYLLMFQNNAEARSLGGNPASMLLLNVEGGALSIVQQASSGDFPPNGEPPIPIEPNIYDVYYPLFPRYVQDITTRPDFPTAALLAQAYWRQEFGHTVDGVISFDPVALASLLSATGPVVLPTGDTLTSENTVPLLLSDVYARYLDPRDQDAFFAAAASEIFAALTSGSGDASALVGKLSQAAEHGRFLAWSSHPEEQAVIAGAPMAGILPTTTASETTAGVYFMDRSSSKIDYWVATAVGFGSDVCENPDDPAFTVTWTLRSTITPEQAEALPPYVVSGLFGPQLFRTEVYVLGPPGTTYEGVSVGAAGLTNEVLSSGTDLGRPIVRLATNLSPGMTTTVSVTFRGDAGDYGPLAVRTTPMVHPTEVAVEQPRCLSR